MFRLGIRFLLIIFSILLVIPVAAQQTVLDTGQVIQCTVREFYGNEEVRTASYWQFQTADKHSIYVVDTYLGMPVCSYLLMDEARDVAYYQEGDIPSYSTLSDFTLEGACLDALAQGGGSGNIQTPYGHITYETALVSEDVEASIRYPNDLLLAPAYIGAFPQLVPAELNSYENQAVQGFSFEMDLAAINEETNISLENGIGQAEQDSIRDFYLQEMPGWEVAPPKMTAYATNPYNLLGRTLYLYLWNPQTEAIIRLEFQLDHAKDLLKVLVSVPPDPDERTSIPVIEGSSAALALKDDLFDGWNGAEAGPTQTFSDGQIESYLLQTDDNRFWQLDLLIESNSFEIIYTRTVTQQNCDPVQFLPEWATQ